MPEPKIRVLLRRTMIATGWSHIALWAFFLLLVVSGLGSMRTPPVTAVFLVMALMSFRLARKMRNDAYWRDFEHV